MQAGNIRMFDLQGRTLGLFGTLDRETCLAASEAILRLGCVPSRRPLHLYLGCEGGEATEVFMLLDCLKARRGRLHTYAMGHVRGMGLLLLAEGDKRFALPHALVSTECLKQPQGLGFNGATSRPSADTGSMIYKHLAGRLGRSVTDSLAQVGTMTSDGALETGLVHRVITTQRSSHHRHQGKSAYSL